MALDRLTKITGPGVATDTNWVGNNANYTGIVTATKFVGPIEGTITSADASFTGNVSIGGTLTYEDVTNVDSVGIITAQKDIHVGAGVSAVGVISATSFVGSGANLTGVNADRLDGIDGANFLRSNTSDTMNGDLTLSGFSPDLNFVSTSNNPDWKITNYQGNLILFDITNNANKFLFRTNEFQSNVIIDARDGMNVVGVATFQDIDVDGHTNLDNVSIAGVTTMTGRLQIDSGDLKIFGTAPTLFLRDTNDNPDYRIMNSHGSYKIFDETNGVDRFIINPTGNVSILRDLDVDGHTNLDNVSIAGVTTITGSGNALEIVGGLVRSRNTASARFVANNGSAEGYFGWSSGVLTVGQAAATLSLEATGSNHIQLKTNGNERLRITSDGKMSLGTSIHATPAAALHIDNDTNNMLMLDNSSASTQKIFFAQDGATHAQIYATSSQGSLIFESDPSNNHNDSVINFTIDGTSRFRINNSGISTFSGDVAVYGSKFKLPVGTSNPSSPLAGDAYFNTSAKTFKIYDGAGWGSVLFAASGSQQNPATSASNLGATGSIATYYFSPDGGTAFQHQAAGGVANFGTIPSGGPSWVGSHNSCILIEKSQVGATTQYKLSQANFLKFIAESITRTGNTPYIYWAVFDTGTLWGIWRIRWTGATYSSWVSGHDYNGTNTPPSGTPSSDVWKTGSGSTGNTLATGSYTVSNESNLVRAVLPGAAYSGGGSYGIHYKRYDDGEHYPWRNSAGNCTSNGYFRPSGTYGMGTDTRYVHYIYLSDS